LGGLAALEVAMLKVNTNDIKEDTWTSPNGKFTGAGKEVSEALGRKPKSMDLNERHPFDVEILRIPPGATPYPYHSHSAQWEFYHVIAGAGAVRHEDGTTAIGPGDAFLFKPNQAHQVSNTGSADLVLYVVADNPIGEAHYYPDSEKWGVPIPQRTLLRSEPLDYFDGEE
jgi:mannose-6-phosphate isomerase-like protein (cupin superfamily)